MSPDEINARFREYPAGKDQAEMHTTVHQMCGDLAQKLNLIVPDGREKSVMLTHLEDAMTWAEKGIERHWGRQ